MPFVQRNAEGAIIGRFANCQSGFAEEWLDDRHPELAPSQNAVLAQLCTRIDAAADAARRAVAGDPLRALEHDRARQAAEAFAAAGYQGEVPTMVAAWAINGRSPQQAADSILAEAAAYTAALELLRATRLAAKEHVRALMAAGDTDQAIQLTEQTTADLAACVQGVGNA